MRPDERARFAAAITLSKAKMYEYGVPVEHHLELPQGLDLEQQFPLAIGTVGDIASEIVADLVNSNKSHHRTPRDEGVFAAQVLQAFEESRLNEGLSPSLRLLAAAAFYLVDVPGRTAVLVRSLNPSDFDERDKLQTALRVALAKPWDSVGSVDLERREADVLSAMTLHFLGANGASDARQPIAHLRSWAYEVGSAHELLLADLLGAICSTRIANSAWTLLPGYSGLHRDRWKNYLSRPDALKEMWPSQRMLGEAGIYRGESGVVQMPTSAGKTRAIELVLRAAFLAERTKLAIVVAPFRALCHEIADDLNAKFLSDGYQVNQISDALQSDLPKDLLEAFFLSGASDTPHVVVLTPEKLLYVLRQNPRAMERIGLVVYDEGHQFDTGTRGVTYELLVTSIKRMLPSSAQTVLISAVIENAPAIANWLLQDEKRVVADRWLQTRRLVAFASSPKNRVGQLRFNVALDDEQEFFVPRVIVRERLRRLGHERSERHFPTEQSGSVALYLALRLARNGAVAIYVRTKASAAKIVRDAVEDTFVRGVSLQAPAKSSNADELRRFENLFAENFGSDSYLTKGVALGVFAHHGNTPHGLRLAIEHAMRHGYIRLLVCTSTLAQGVNLPLRYLLITSPMQGREAIRSRDFHNLIGRAGRAGMFGEGTIVFTDARLYDERGSQPRRWRTVRKLLQADETEPTGSTLLSLLEPMYSDNGQRKIERPSPFDIATGLVDDPDAVYGLVARLPDQALRHWFSRDSLTRQLDMKKKTIEAVESFLMTYRGDVDSDSFVSTSRSLSRETLAFFLATADQKGLLEDVFERVARRIEAKVPDVLAQARYGRTLLGIDKSLAVDEWVNANRSELQAAESADMLFVAVWPLLASLCVESRLHDTEPVEALFLLAQGWLAGKAFREHLSDLEAAGARYPYGAQSRRFTIDGVVELCEQTFGYEFSLLLAAVRDSYVASAADEESGAQFSQHVDLLQKRLKYGLPTQGAISIFEAGFSERVVAQRVAAWLEPEIAKSPSAARELVRDNADGVRTLIGHFPSYFNSVLDGIVD